MERKRSGIIQNLRYPPPDDHSQDGDKQLLASFEISEFLFQEHPDGIYIIDRTGRFVGGNSMAEKITGYKKEELIGRHFLKVRLLPRKQLLKASAMFTKLLSGSDNVHDEFTLIRKDNSTIEVELSARVIHINGERYVLGSARNITEKAELLYKLKDSEERWQGIISNSQPIIFLLDRMGIFQLSEGQSLNRIGLKPGQVVGMSAYEIYKDNPQILKNIKLALKGRTAQNKVNVGDAVFETFFSPMRDLQGKTTGVLGMAIDITERELAEEKSMVLGKLIETSLNEIYIFDAQTLKFIEVNQGARDNLGYSLEELKHLTPIDIKPLLTIKQFEELVAPLRSGFKKKILINTIHLRKNHTTYPVDISLQLLDMGKPVFVAMVVDTTERDAALKAIQEKEANYKSLFNQIADPILVFDQNTYYILDCNQSAIERYGYTLQEFLSMTPHDLHPPEDLERVNRNINDRTTSAPNEYIHVTKAGKLFNVEIHTQEINYKGENAWISIIRDVTERKQAEIELKAAKSKAEESDRLKSAFLANMSHEIRTPMNAILGFSELLDDPDIDREDQSQYLKMIRDSGNRLMALISDLIDISKIEAGELRLSIFPVKVRELLESLHGMFHKEAERSGVKLEFEFPSQHRDLTVLTDKDRLSQVLINLIKNAIKFTDEGKVTFGVRILKKSIKFFVSDTGVGIDKSFGKRIFDRFTQGELSYSRKYEGTGLGLSITKALVELLGGKIWFESEPGKGSTFYFTVPRT